MGQFRTPLRYPGGKQRLAPFIDEILVENNLIGGHYVEPFAGGAGVGIELLINERVDHIHLNDSDFSVYAFWHSVVNNPDELCRRIMTASLTVQEWEHRKAVVKECNQNDVLELGFSVFFLNRVNRSGVLSAGIIGGRNQDGNYKMDARFSRNDLVRRIESIALRRGRITVTNHDAEAYVADYIPHLPVNTLIYFDPPYYNQGGNLYLNAYKKQDHQRLARAIQQVQHNWILSYDGVSDIIDLYENRRHFLYNLQYTAANVYKGKEVFIFCDGLLLPAQPKLKHIAEGMSNLVA